MHERYGIGDGRQLATVDVLGLLLLCIKVHGVDIRTLQQQLTDARSRIDELERATAP